jgi:N-acetylneuraminic acid mutarotase
MTSWLMEEQARPDEKFRFVRMTAAVSAIALGLIGLAGVLAARPAQPTRAPGPSPTPFQAGHWEERTKLPTAVSEDAVAAVDDKLYVLGGYALGSFAQPLVQAYDPVTDAWKSRAPMPRGLNHAAVTAFDGKIYTFGGFVEQNRNAVADCNVYDPVSDKWSAIAPLVNKRGAIAVAVLDGKIHAVGGRDVLSVGEHDVYDPASNTWSSAQPLPQGEGRDHLGLLAYEGKLYAIAGRFNDFNHNTNLVERYDPATDRWSELPRIPTARSGGAAVVYHGLLLYIGGERKGGTFTENEAFDPVAGRWLKLTPLALGRHGTGAALIGDAVYLPAGGPVNGGKEQSKTLFVYSQP